MTNYLLTVSHHVARVTLHNPPANVLSTQLLKELDRVLSDVEEDPYIRVVFFTGSGRFFCAGADINELAHLNTMHAASEFATRGQALLNRIERSDKPMIAAINGTCLGGGLELALACHIRLAATGAMLGLPEARLGLIPGFGGTQRLPRIVGPSRAVEMILTGESVPADEAARIGLVSRVLSSEALLVETDGLARAIISSGETAVQTALHAVRGGLDIPLSEGMAREAELFGQLCTTSEKHQAVQAFLDKRHPKAAAGAES